MSTVPHGRRVAMVISALAGPELIAGKNDVNSVFDVLIDPALGQCDALASRKLVGCPTDVRCLETLGEVCRSLDLNDLFIFYFSGHGEIRGDDFGLLFGPDRSHFFPLSNLVTTLSATYRIRRAILIIDACYSGHAVHHIKSADGHLPFLDNRQLPLGFAILTSCRDIEQSRENPDTAVSIYTAAFCEGIKTSLNGRQPHHRPFITVTELQTHIKEVLTTNAASRQHPEILVRGDSDIWISRNQGYNAAAALLPEPNPTATANLLTHVVLVVDIADFSLQTRTNQRRLTASIWKFLEQVGYKKWRDTFSEPRAGGAVVIFGLKSTTYLQILRIAVEWIKFMRRGKPPVGLRIGLHVGNTYNEKNSIHSTPQLVGKAINECEGIAAIADPGSVLVSEEFFKELLEAERDTNVRPAFIPDSDPPYEVFVKPEVPQQIRAYRWEPDQKPSVFRFIRSLRNHIMSHLAAIEHEFVSFCGWCNKDLTRTRLSARISIFAPESISVEALHDVTQSTPNDLGRARVLGSSRYRYHPFDEKCLQPGPTKYGLEGDGQGTLGRAFKSKKTKIITGLPNYKDDKSAYIKRLKTEFDVPVHVIENFQRHARAFIAIPMGLEEDESDIVVCIDTLGHDLGEIPEEYILQFADEVQSHHGEVLAALWRLRLI